MATLRGVTRIHVAERGRVSGAGIFEPCRALPAVTVSQQKRGLTIMRAAAAVLPGVTAAVAARKRTLARPAMPAAWEASLRLVEEVGQLCQFLPGDEVLALLKEVKNGKHQTLPSPAAPKSQPLYVPPKGHSRTFLYDAEGEHTSGAPIVACGGWADADDAERARLLQTSLSVLKANGFVVLERLLPADKLEVLLQDFRKQRESLPEGVTFSRMRAQRDMTIPPFDKMWAQDDVICHPLILALLARYLRNSTNMSEEKASEMTFAHWLGAGGDIEEFTSGQSSAGFPELDLMVVVDTPSGAPAQTQHRDTILPGPCASLGVHIPLTPMQAEPLNGAIGFFPGSHVLKGELSGKKSEELVGASAPGSVILYDSFTEHRGLENESSEPRAALFAWFRVPGVYTGHTEENFGPEGLRRADEFRRYLRPRLRKVATEQRQACPGASGPAAEEAWGFSQDSELVPWTRNWGEERCCFRCNCTALQGWPAPPAPGAGGGRELRNEWYCSNCWEEARALRGEGAAPEPWPGSVAAPWDQPDRVSEERLLQLQAQGLNISPGKGRHKLTILRERGYFLPVDPLNSWLDRVSNDPQPSGWKDAMKKALGEVPRFDGF